MVYIQPAFAVSDSGKMRQEQGSLIHTGDGFIKIIITKDAPAPLYNEDGVLVKNVFDFLPDPDSMDIIFFRDDAVLNQMKKD